MARVFKVVRPFARDRIEAEDVVQETFLAAWAHLGRYRPRPGARFVSWLCAIAVNAARRRARWWRRMVLEPETREDVADERDAGEALDLARRESALLAALDDLPARNREVVVLR